MSSQAPFFSQRLNNQVTIHATLSTSGPILFAIDNHGNHKGSAPLTPFLTVTDDKLFSVTINHQRKPGIALGYLDPMAVNRLRSILPLSEKRLDLQTFCQTPVFNALCDWFVAHPVLAKRYAPYHVAGFDWAATVERTLDSRRTVRSTAAKTTGRPNAPKPLFGTTRLGRLAALYEGQAFVHCSLDPRLPPNTVGLLERAHVSASAIDLDQSIMTPVASAPDARAFKTFFQTTAIEIPAQLPFRRVPIAFIVETPWSPSDTAEIYGAGITSFECSHHGGFFVAPSLNKKIPKVWRSKTGWYEEDCDWSAVALTFSQLFDKSEVAYAQSHYGFTE